MLQFKLKGAYANQEPKHPPQKNMICFLFATLPRCLSHVCIAAASTIEHAPMLCVLSCQFNGQGNLTKRYVLEYACALFLEMEVVLYIWPKCEKCYSSYSSIPYYVLLKTSSKLCQVWLVQINPLALRVWEVRIMMNKLIFKTYSYVKYD
jgi:hypothetical protein